MCWFLFAGFTVYTSRSHYQEKSFVPEIKGAANPQMCHCDGLEILNLEDWGETGNLKAALDFSGGSEIWKAMRPGCSLNMPIGMLDRSEAEDACFICTWPANSPFLFAFITFCTALLINISTCNILRSRAIQHEVNFCSKN